MFSKLRRPFTEEELIRMAAAMNWVIPPDSTPGAGSPEGVRLLTELVISRGLETTDRYQLLLPLLLEADLDDRSNSFAQEFIEDVRNVYYSNSETGSWQDIGFVVSG